MEGAYVGIGRIEAYTVSFVDRGLSMEAAAATW